MIGVLFPGQGTQTRGMGDLWRDRPEWRIANAAWQVSTIDVPALLTTADDFELERTPNTQIAVTTVSLMAWEALRAVGVTPTMVAGHSLGEYTAFAASGALSTEQTLWLVAARGHAMAAACDHTSGVMMAVKGLTDDQVAACCARADGDVWIAGFNSPNQIVIAGQPSAVERAAELAENSGATVRPLPVEGAFHTPYMAPSKPSLLNAADQLHWMPPQTPVVTNVDGQPHRTADTFRSMLGAHLCNPVRWRQTLETMRDGGCQGFVVCGPGDQLARFSAKTVPDLPFVVVDTPDKVTAAAELVERLQAASVARNVDHATSPKVRPVGERVGLTERMVVSPTQGVFTPAVAEGIDVTEGTVLGHVNGEPVTSPWAGQVAGMLALEGERIKRHQPVVWMRPHDTHPTATATVR